MQQGAIKQMDPASSSRVKGFASSNAVRIRSNVVTITNLVKSYASEKNTNIYKLEYFSVCTCYTLQVLIKFLSYER